MRVKHLIKNGGISMDFAFSKELEMIRKAAREFAEKEIMPYADEWDRQHYLPIKEVVRKMGELGFLGTVIPEAYGGEEMGWMATSVITEELARASSSVRVQINLIGVGLCTHRILPGMLERGVGRIVNVASRGAQSTAARNSGYASSKAGVVSFTKNIANTIDREKYPDVLVNAIIPGITKTNIWSRAFGSGVLEEDFLARFQEPEAVYPHTRFIVDLPPDGPNGRTFFYGEDYPVFSRFNV